MLKRIIALMCLVLLWTSVGFAEAQWEKVSDTEWIDLNSIKIFQMDYDEIVKVNTKSPIKNDGTSLATILINKDSKMFCYTLMEQYDKDGNKLNRMVIDPKDRRNWLVFTDSSSINEILKRAN